MKPEKIVYILLAVGGILFGSAATEAALADSLFTQARSSAEGGDYAAALECIAAILEVDSANTDALLLEGLVYLWQNRFDKSTPLFKKVITLAPGYRDAWVSLVYSYERSREPSAACSTCRAACAIFTADTELTALSERICMPPGAGRSVAPSGETAVIEAHAGAGGTLFERSYDRAPWGTLYGGVEVRRNRWGIATQLHAERRKYGDRTLYGGEVEVAPQVKVHQKLSAGLRLSFSPYALVDTLLASRGITAEVNGGLPGGVEIDAAARLRWYGLQFSHSYSCGIGKYLGHFLAGGRLFIAAFEKSAYYSGMVELRRFSSHHEAAFGLISVAMGRTPFDAGTLTKSGYLSFVEGGCRVRIPFGYGYSVMPAAAVAGERVTRRGDVNGDGIDDLQRGSVRMKTSLTVTFFMKLGAGR